MMADKNEIKKVILKVAGNPESGVVAQFADAWAEAIVALDAPVPAPEVKREDEEPVKETRVLNVAEKR
jgi:hypothetical protein